MKALYLIRHGEIGGRNPKRFIGRTDLPLTPRGGAQLEHLGRHLLAAKIETIIASPLQRCRRSAAILQTFWGGEIELCDAFAEIDLGDWDGLEVAEVKRQFPGEYAARGKDLAGYAPPGGESFEVLSSRVVPAFYDVTKRNTGVMAVVAHAGVNRVLLCSLLGIPLHNLFVLGQDYGCFNRIVSGKNGLQVDCLNCLPTHFS